MKPRLFDDIHFVPWPQGAFVVLGSRRDMGFNIRGRDTHAWLKRLAPFLNGEHTVAELGRSLSESQRDRMRFLVDRLAREGVLRDATHDQPHTLSERVRRDHARIIGFINRNSDLPEHRFQCYRESKPIVVGSGRLVPPLVQALFATGVAQVRLLITPDGSTDLVRMRECLEAVLPVDPDRQLQIETTDRPLDLSHGTAGALLHVSDRNMPTRVRALARLCAERNLVFGQATTMDDQAWVGPVTGAFRPEPGCETQCDALALLEGEEPRGEGHVSSDFTGPAAAFVANHLCVGLLKQITGLLNEGDRHVTVIDLATFKVEQRPLASAAPLHQEAS